MGKLQVGKPGLGILCDSLEKRIWLSLIDFNLKEQKLGKLSVINQVLAIWGQLLQELLFSFLRCY